MTEEKLIILGAAGRDFHDFMTYWSIQPNVTVQCFTGTQIPGIAGRYVDNILSNVCKLPINGLNFVLILSQSVPSRVVQQRQERKQVSRWTHDLQ